MHGYIGHDVGIRRAPDPVKKMHVLTLAMGQDTHVEDWDEKMQVATRCLVAYMEPPWPDVPGPVFAFVGMTCLRTAARRFGLNKPSSDAHSVL